jgi:hypothetical protein
MYFVNFPAQSNKASFTNICELKDAVTGDLIDLTDTDLTFNVLDDHCVRLTATIGSGITLIPDYDGYFEIAFTASQMGALCEGSYQCHLIATREDITRDVFAGNLPIVID